MMRQVRRTTVEILLGLSSHLDVDTCVGMRSVVSSCLFGERFPGEPPFAILAGCMRE